MENKSLVSGALILVALCLGLFFVIYFVTGDYKETEAPTSNHQYDYIIEVNGDSTLTYNIYDEKHNIVADSVLSTQLDSVIIKDNE